MATLDLSKIVPIYQSAIDGVINQMGKPVLLVFEDTVTNMTDNFQDKVDDFETKKPLFKADSISDQPVITQNTKIITSLIQHNPKDFKTYDINVKEGTDIVRLKSFLTDVPDLDRCKYIIPNYSSIAIIGYKYRMLKNPVPRGLQIDRYAVSYWYKVG
jgi:hypothetical protein